MFLKSVLIGSQKLGWESNIYNIIFLNNIWQRVSNQKTLETETYNWTFKIKCSKQKVFKRNSPTIKRIATNGVYASGSVAIL